VGGGGGGGGFSSWFSFTKIYSQYLISRTTNVVHIIFLKFDLSKKTRCNAESSE
jgi:hypothetical protein